MNKIENKPIINEKQTTLKRPKKITESKLILTNNNGTPFSLSNIAFGLSEAVREKKYSSVTDNIGWEDMERVIKHIINNADYSARGVAKALNESEISYTNWKPIEDTNRRIIVEAIDAWGNEHQLIVFPKQSAINEEHAKHIIQLAKDMGYDRDTDLLERIYEYGKNDVDDELKELLKDIFEYVGNY